MLWDIGNTVLEFLTVYLLFAAFAHMNFVNRHLLIYTPIALGLSVFFCIDVPHVLVLNVGLFILAECISFSCVPLKDRILYACFAVFITLSLEMFFNTFLPIHLLHTFRGDTIANLVMVVVVAVYWYISIKGSFHFDIAAFMKRRYILLIICFVIWASLTQVYLQKASELWSYLPGVISIIFFLVFVIGAILDIQFIRSEEHKQNILYKENLNTINSYLQELKIENHDYKHHIHHLQDMIRSSSDLEVLRSDIDIYVSQLEQSSELSDAILAIDNSLFRALLYGTYIRCNQQHIPLSFTASSLLPSFPVKDYQLVATFENLVANAIEANDAIQDERKRFIKINIFADSNQNLLAISNPLSSFSGDINDYYISGITSKDPTVHYGLGLNSVLSIMTSHGIDFYGKYDNDTSTIKFTLSYTRKEAKL